MNPLPSFAGLRDNGRLAFPVARVEYTIAAGIWRVIFSHGSSGFAAMFNSANSLGIRND